MLVVLMLVMMMLLLLVGRCSGWGRGELALVLLVHMWMLLLVLLWLVLGRVLRRILGWCSIRARERLVMVRVWVLRLIARGHVRPAVLGRVGVGLGVRVWVLRNTGGWVRLVVLWVARGLLHWGRIALREVRAQGGVKGVGQLLFELIRSELAASPAQLR